jgi:hypothetical protein
MCCFSGPVAEVGHTNLFARAGAGNRQFLVYQMELRAEAPMAMILPLPVPPRSPDDAVRFLDFSTYPSFFADLYQPFAGAASSTRTGGGGGLSPLPEPRLTVHRVGSFEASFVPHRDDFARLDERFRLPSGVWDLLPRYADWGFAVFKLHALQQASVVEPMALEFPRRDAGLFFPTVHIHDGAVHERARFDHNLYFQSAAQESVVAVGNQARRAAGSFTPAREFTSALHARGVLDEELPVQVVRFAGELPNRDAHLVAPVADAELDAFAAWDEKPMPVEAAVQLVARLAASRCPDAPYDPPAAIAALTCLPWALQRTSFGEGYRYAAPEWAQSQGTDERSEVYAFAALLYHLVAGRPLFGDGIEGLVGHIMKPPPPFELPSVDLILGRVLGRALAKDPAERQQTLVELVESLLQALGQLLQLRQR